ncbi:MAG: polyhydroxybutyrate depolymerase [Actinobacteria bacterium HGW-Actinobacteria-2]|nr:MAG: polyhydroxybutyrate depolymerase [Actinobacteria bacterium HGW-Actinobacteria-2]
MHRRFVVLLAVVTAVLAGCTGHRPVAPTPSGGALAVGTTSFSLDVSGQQRSYLVHRPAADAPASGYPLVVVLHGGLGSAALAEEAYGWDALADRDGFVVVYPNGVDRTWNAGTCCGTAARTGVDDVAFITQVVSQVSALVPVDPTRRFATGMSNGAMMTYRLACQTGLFAAIAPVSGTQLIDCSTAEPVSVLHIHGAADPTVRPDGKRGSGPAHVTGPPLARVWEGWRVRDDCGRFDVTRSAEVTSGQASCPSQRTVEWILITDGGHEWPGGRSSTNPAGLDATALIWTFFAAHPHR